MFVGSCPSDRAEMLADLRDRVDQSLGELRDALLEHGGVGQSSLVKELGVQPHIRFDSGREITDSPSKVVSLAFGDKCATRARESLERQVVLEVVRDVARRGLFKIEERVSAFDLGYLRKVIDVVGAGMPKYQLGPISAHLRQDPGVELLDGKEFGEWQIQSDLTVKLEALREEAYRAA